MFSSDKRLLSSEIELMAFGHERQRLTYRPLSRSLPVYMFNYNQLLLLWRNYLLMYLMDNCLKLDPFELCWFPLLTRTSVLPVEVSN